MNDHDRTIELQTEIDRLSAEYREADADRQTEIAKRIAQLEGELEVGEPDPNQAAKSAVDRATRRTDDH